MDEIHLEILRSQQVMASVQSLVAIEVFGVAIILALCAYLTRGTRAAVERADEILREVREDSKRLNYYLFSKFGPAETK